MRRAALRPLPVALGSDRRRRIRCRDVGGRSRAAVLAAGMVGSSSPDRDLAGVPARLPARARARRPAARGGVLERPQGRRRRDELQRPALRADAAAVRRAAALARVARELDVLDVRVHRRRRSRCSGSTSAGTTSFASFRNTMLLANVIGLLGYIVDADGAAAAARARVRRTSRTRTA